MTGPRSGLDVSGEAVVAMGTTGYRPRDQLLLLGVRGFLAWA